MPLRKMALRALTLSTVGSALSSQSHAPYVLVIAAREWPLTSFDEIRENFSFLEDWEDRYRYLIELGRELEPLPPALKTDATKVRGCASQVWMLSRPSADPATGENRINIIGESDAHIVQGLIAVLLAIHNGKTSQEILETDADHLFDELGLKEYLTPQRSNGLASMIARIRSDARRLAEGANAEA